jgi:hypothetical protein
LGERREQSRADEGRTYENRANDDGQEDGGVVIEEELHGIPSPCGLRLCPSSRGNFIVSAELDSVN